MSISYAAGTGSQPLLGETIGANLDRTVARVPEREALVVPFQGVRLHVPATRRRGGPRSRARSWRWGSRTAIESVSGARTAPSGSCSSTRPPRSAYPRQHQSRVPHARARVRARAIGLPDARRGDRVQGERLPRHGRGSAAGTSAARARRLPRHRRTGTQFTAGAATIDDGCGRPARRRAARSTIRSTSSTRAARPASPKGRRSAITTSSTTASSSARDAGTPMPTASASLYRSTTASEWCSATSRARRTAPRWCCPRLASSPAPPWKWSPRNGARACTACPRCSSPSSALDDFATFDLSSLRTGIMAGAPCPIEVMKRCVVRDAHGRGDDRLRHDRDVTGVDADGCGRPDRPARRHGRARAPVRRDQDRRTRLGNDGRAR